VNADILDPHYFAESRPTRVRVAVQKTGIRDERHNET